MKPSRLEIRRVEAQESTAEALQIVLEQLAEISSKLDKLLGEPTAKKAKKADEGEG